MQVRSVAELAADDRKAAPDALPEWDLSDLYPGRDSEALHRDLTDLTVNAETFRAAFEGRLAGLSGAELGAAIDAVCQEPGGFGLVREGARACVAAQLGLELMADRPGLHEADQAPGEDRGLRGGGQPDGQPSGGEVVDGGPAAVGSGDAAVDGPASARWRPVLRDTQHADAMLRRPGRRTRAGQAAARRDT